jgi:Ran GTPase-activating protein (RanGAP) involved in mRNA processing and transport
MTGLNLSDNSIGGHADEPGAHALADMLKNNTTLKEINISSNSLDKECAQILAPAIKDNGAMTSLNLSRNWIRAEGAKHIAGALEVSKCVLAIILAPLSCPSDQYFNCWCLLLSPGYGGDDIAEYQ